MKVQDDATLVLDIGKTNCKLTLLDAQGRTLAERRRPNAVLAAPLYPRHDVEGIFAWMLGVMREFAGLAHVSAVVPVTHGATAALIDDDGLVLPVLDYEAALPGPFAYARPGFDETRSPALPVGLNLGRQLAWQQANFPAQFARARHVLMYPQYWAWRLCGVAASEVTSLGCHTDLWNPAAQTFSSLVEARGWPALFPPRREAWSPLGPLLPALAAQTGLPADCQVICGIHDSNASLLRHLVGSDAARTVLSTGTWVIAASLGAPDTALDEAQDMLANCDVFGRPVACMRYMGGREFSALADGAEMAAFDTADLERLVARDSFALPCFAESGGPFAGQAGRIEGPLPSTPAERAALATLYSALMTDHCLSALAARGPVFIEGAFTKNPFFGPLLAALRPAGQGVFVSDDGSGTTSGGWMLHRWGRCPAPNAAQAQPLALPGWSDYRQRWHRRIAVALPGIAG